MPHLVCACRDTLCSATVAARFDTTVHLVQLAIQTRVGSRLPTAYGANFLVPFMIN